MWCVLLYLVLLNNHVSICFRFLLIKLVSVKLFPLSIKNPYTKKTRNILQIAQTKTCITRLPTSQIISIFDCVVFLRIIA